MKIFKTPVSYEYKKVNTREILVDPLYQRDLSKAKVTRILKEFNPHLVNAPKVSFREGKFWVFDGQHTIAATKAKYGHDIVIDCKVFYGLTRLDEMELFIAQNGISSAVSVNEKYRALFNNGDKDVVGMVRACERVGIRVDFTRGPGKNKVIALATLMRSYQSLTTKQFADMLTTLKNAWGGIPESFSAELINGLTKFYMIYDGDFSKKRLLNVLQKTSPIVIVRDGKISSASGSAKYARIILGIYNKGTSVGRLDDKL